ncbi:MAG: hypothetical protein HGB21_00425 [Nitrospirae bacterium]|nr:hypothetical protein [Nitrospirota bacterium]NTW64765.1 hypothetical protein [Nitrospirota bacterium]
MTFTKEQQKLFLGALIAVIVLVNGYRLLTAEGPRTAPLMYDRGAVASAPVRPAAQARGRAADPLSVILERSAEPYPGVVRNIFRMENPAARPKPTMPVVVTAPSPSAPERSPEEIAADLARADLAKFRYLGYLSEKETTLFLSKGGELFIVKIGDTIGTTYKIKEANKDFIIILDTATRVEGRVSLSGEGTPSQQSPQPQPPQPQQPQYAPQPQRPQRPPYAPQPVPPPVSQP